MPYCSHGNSCYYAGIMMVLTAAFEFDPVQAKLVKGRPSDDAELNDVCDLSRASQPGNPKSLASPPQLIRSRSLPHIDIKTKERPFSCPYAAKARILVHAHLERLDLPPHTLRTGASPPTPLLLTVRLFTSSSSPTVHLSRPICYVEVLSTPVE